MDVVDRRDVAEHARVERQFPRLQHRRHVPRPQHAHHPKLKQGGDPPAREQAAFGHVKVAVADVPQRLCPGCCQIAGLRVEPLSGPGVLGDVVRASLHGEGSVGVCPAAWLLRWTVGFLRSSGCRRHWDGLRAVLDLAAWSVERFGELRASGVEFEMHRRGLLLAARTEHDMDEALALVTALGGQAMTATRRCTPGRRRPAGTALSDSARRRVCLGRSARAGRVCVGRVARGAGREGAELRGVAVRGVERDGAAGWPSPRTGTGRPCGDRRRCRWRPCSATSAAGAALSGKGYSVTGRGTGTGPVHPVRLLEVNVSCSPSTTE